MSSNLISARPWNALDNDGSKAFQFFVYETVLFDTATAWLRDHGIVFTAVRHCDGWFICSDRVSDPDLILLFRMRWEA